jgi:putative chitinase
MTTITLAQLVGIMPRNRQPAAWIGVLNEALARFEINSTERIAAFLAQIAHESAELNRLLENLNYSAQGLLATWPRRFASLEAARQFERNPQRIANHVYANRMGNGDLASGDGWKYRGRGVIQLTGRGNYRAVGNAIGLPFESDPDLLLAPGPAALAAGFFWKSRGLNELADDRSGDDDDEDFVAITVRINGGRAGLADRRRYWERAHAVLRI